MKTLAQVEQELIRERLKRFNYDISAAADSLGVSRAKLYRFLETERARLQSFKMQQSKRQPIDSLR